jgi:hypothetical protein
MSFLIAISVNIWLGASSVAFTYPKSQELVLYTYGCNNITDHIREPPSSHYYPTDPVLYYLYTISSIWYCVFSLLFVLIFGTLTSLVYSLIVTRTCDLDSVYDEKPNFLFSLKKIFL